MDKEILIKRRDNNIAEIKRLVEWISNLSIPEREKIITTIQAVNIFDKFMKEYDNSELIGDNE